MPFFENLSSGTEAADKADPGKGPSAGAEIQPIMMGSSIQRLSLGNWRHPRFMGVLLAAYCHSAKNQLSTEKFLII
jgi:hypothetical protein